MYIYINCCTIICEYDLLYERYFSRSNNSCSECKADLIGYDCSMLNSSSENDYRTARIDNQGFVKTFKGLLFSYRSLGYTKLFENAGLKISVLMSAVGSQPLRVAVTEVVMHIENRGEVRVTAREIYVDGRRVNAFKNHSIGDYDISRPNLYTVSIDNDVTLIKLFIVDGKLDLTIHTSDCMTSTGLFDNCNNNFDFLHYKNGSVINVNDFSRLKFSNLLFDEFGEPSKLKDNLSGNSARMINSSFTTAETLCSFSDDVSFGIKFKIKEISTDSPLLVYINKGNIHGFSVYIKAGSNILMLKSVRKLSISSLFIEPNHWYSFTIYWQHLNSMFHLSLLRDDEQYDSHDIISIGFNAIRPCGYLTVGQLPGYKINNDFNGWMDDLVIWPNEKRTNSWNIDISTAVNYWNFDVMNSDGSITDYFRLVDLVPSWKRSTLDAANYSLYNKDIYKDLFSIDNNVNDHEINLLCDQIYNEIDCVDKNSRYLIFTSNCQHTLTLNRSNQSSNAIITSLVDTVTSMCNTNNISSSAEIVCRLTSNCSPHCVYGIAEQSGCVCVTGFWGPECSTLCNDHYDRCSNDGVVDCGSNMRDNCDRCATGWQGDACQYQYTERITRTCYTIGSNTYKSFNGLTYRINTEANLLLYRNNLLSLYLKQSPCLEKMLCINQLLFSFETGNKLIIGLNQDNKLIRIINGSINDDLTVFEQEFNLTVYINNVIKLRLSNRDIILIRGYEYFISITLTIFNASTLSNIGICSRPDDENHFNKLDGKLLNNLNQSYLDYVYSNNISIDNDTFVNLNYSGMIDRCLTIESNILFTKKIKNKQFNNNQITYQLSFKLFSNLNMVVLNIKGHDNLLLIVENVHLSLYINGNSIIKTDFNLSTYEWYSLSLVYKNEYFQLFLLNDEYNKMWSIPFSYNISEEFTIKIGDSRISEHNVTNDFKGDINNLMIWNRALTENQVLRSRLESDLYNNYDDTFVIFLFDEISHQGVYFDSVSGIPIYLSSHAVHTNVPCHVNNGHSAINEPENPHRTSALEILCKDSMNTIHKVCDAMPRSEVDMFISTCITATRVIQSWSTVSHLVSSMATVCHQKYNTTVDMICSLSDVTRETCDEITRIESGCQFGEVKDNGCECDQDYWGAFCSNRCESLEVVGSQCDGICNLLNGECISMDETPSIFNDSIFPQSNAVALYGGGNVLASDNRLSLLTTAGIYNIINIGDIIIKGRYIYCSIDKIVCLYSIIISDIKDTIIIGTGDSFYSTITESAGIIEGLNIKITMTFACELIFNKHPEVKLNIYKTGDYLNAIVLNGTSFIQNTSIVGTHLLHITDTYNESNYAIYGVELSNSRSFSTYLLQDIFNGPLKSINFDLIIKALSSHGIIMSYTNANGNVFSLLYNETVILRMNTDTYDTNIILKRDAWTRITLSIPVSPANIEVRINNDLLYSFSINDAGDYFTTGGYLCLGDCRGYDTLAAGYALLSISSPASYGEILVQWTFNRFNASDEFIRCSATGEYLLYANNAQYYHRPLRSTRHLVTLDPAFHIPIRRRAIVESMSRCEHVVSYFSGNCSLTDEELIRRCRAESIHSNGDEQTLLALVLVLDSLCADFDSHSMCADFRLYPLYYGEGCERKCYFRDYSTTNADDACLCMDTHTGTQCDSIITACSMTSSGCACPPNRDGVECISCSQGYLGLECSVMDINKRGYSSMVAGGVVITLEGLAFMYRDQGNFILYTDENLTINAVQINSKLVFIHLVFVTNTSMEFSITNLKKNIRLNDEYIFVVDMNAYIINHKFSLYRIDKSIYRIKSDDLTLELEIQNMHINLLLITDKCVSSGLLGYSCSDSNAEFIYNHSDFTLIQLIKRFNLMTKTIEAITMKLNNSAAISSIMPYFSDRLDFTIVVRCLIIFHEDKDSVIYTYKYKDEYSTGIYVRNGIIYYTQRDITVMFYIDFKYNQWFDLSLSYNNIEGKLLLIYKNKYITTIRQRNIFLPSYNIIGHLYLGGYDESSSSFIGGLEYLAIWNKHFTISTLTMTNVIIVSSDSLIYYWMFNKMQASSFDIKRGIEIYLHPATTWIPHYYEQKYYPSDAYELLPPSDYASKACNLMLNKFSNPCDSLRLFVYFICTEALATNINHPSRGSSLIYESALLYGWHCSNSLLEFNLMCNQFEHREFPIYVGSQCDIMCIFGEYRNNICSCDLGYYGSSCELYCIGGTSDMCHGHGICSGLGGECDCDFNWRGYCAYS